MNLQRAGSHFTPSVPLDFERNRSCTRLGLGHAMVGSGERDELRSAQRRKQMNLRPLRRGRLQCPCSVLVESKERSRRVSGLLCLKAMAETTQRSEIQIEQQKHKGGPDWTGLDRTGTDISSSVRRDPKFSSRPRRMIASEQVSEHTDGAGAGAAGSSSPC